MGKYFFKASRAALYIITVQIPVLTFLLSLFLFGGGCASPSSPREQFSRTTAGLSPSLKSLYLDTLRIIKLLERWEVSLEKENIRTLLRCYSTRYWYYDRGIAGLRERLEESYFNPYQSLKVSLAEIKIELIEPDSGYWLRQDDFDWLKSRAASLPFRRNYRLEIKEDTEMPAGKFTLSLSSAAAPERDRVPTPEEDGKREGRPRRFGRDEDKEVFVETVFRVDRRLERPLAEVGFLIKLVGKAAGDSGSENLTCRLKERIIFSLEKESGGWRIVSRW